MSSSSDFSSLYISNVLLAPSGHSFANVALPSHPRLQSSYLSSAHFASSPSVPLPPSHVPGCFFYTSCFLSPLTYPRFFNGMLEVSEPGALNYYTSFCLVLLILFVFKNLIFIHLPLSGILDSLLCDLIASTHGLEIPLPLTLEALSFSSGRAYGSLNFLPFLSLFACTLP